MDFYIQKNICLCENIYASGYNKKHGYFKLIYVTDDEGLCTIDGIAYKIAKGNYMLFDSSVVYEFSESLKTASIMFRPELINKKYAGIVKTEQLYKEITVGTGYKIKDEDEKKYIFFSKYVGERINFITDELTKKNFCYAECVKGALLEIILKSVRSISVEEKITDAEAGIKRIISCIDKYYNEDIQLSQFAKEFGFSTSYISECFKKLTGHTFSEYLKITRIKAAHRIILENPQMSIEEVAAKVGYTDMKYFTSVFKKTIGITPAEDCLNIKKYIY